MINKKRVSATFQQENTTRASHQLQSAAPDLMDKPLPWERPALASGIAFVIMQFGALLYFIIFVFPQMGPPDAVEQHLAFYTRHREILRLGNYLMTLPTVFFLIFLGGLSSILRRTEGGSGVLSTVAVTSGAIVGILWPLSSVVNNIGIDIAQTGGDAATIVAFDAVGVYMLALSALPRTALLVAIGFVLLNSQLSPRWIGWIGLGVGVISIIGSATLVLVDLFPVLVISTLLFELWIFALSIALLQTSRTVSLAG